MSKPNLRFNFGFLIEAASGTRTEFDFNYPRIQVDDTTYEPLAGQFKAVRSKEGVYVEGNIQTVMTAECNRCLDDFTAPVETRVEEMFYYPPSTAPEGEYIITEDGNADLGPVIREVTLLELPIKALCREDCKGLCPECGANHNHESCDCALDDIDPRMAVLKTLLEDIGE